MGHPETPNADSAVALATKAFGETLKRLQLPQDAPELRDPVALGERAALRAVADSTWGKVLGPLFDTEQVKTILGVTSRQGVHDLANRKRLLALGPAQGRKQYPAFQFGEAGRPFAEIPKILQIFEGAVETPYTIASWFVTSQDVLGEDTPASWMRARRDPELLFESARRAVARLAQ
jgi:hypothetical protein